jgi:putative transposase
VTFRFVEAEKANYPITVLCQTLGVSESGFHDWQTRSPSRRQTADAALVATIQEIHQMSRGTYASPRVWAELRLGAGIRVSRKRVERLMRLHGLEGIYRRRRRGCTKRNPAATPAEDLVNRKFCAAGPDRLWVMDVTEHPTGEGKVYLAIVLDAWSRRVVGWSIADHLRAELVCDALDMATWRRRAPKDQTITHSDHGSQPRFKGSLQHRLVGWSVGVRATAAGREPVGVHGIYRRCVRQRGGRELLRDPPARAS